MSHHTLSDASIVNILQSLRHRRCSDLEVVKDWPKVRYDGGDSARTLHITRFIYEHLEGRFFMDMKTVAFEDSKDFTIFRLWFNGQRR